jgi:hypothetical protein
MALCAVVTAVIVATKGALVAPGAIVTPEGTVTALLLLVSPTRSPSDPAAALRFTAQESVVDPVTELLAQLTPLTTGTLVMVPVPLRLTTMLPPFDESLEIVSCPDAGPGAIGSN